MEGSGTIQPRFEDLVRVVPSESGMVCRVMAERLQEVQAGEPLFEYIPEGKFSVLSYSRMTTPGGAEPEPEPLSDWYQKAERKRIARIEAANRWSARVLSQVKNARKWESDLAQRLTMAVPREEDLLLVQAQRDENIRLGRGNANQVYIFDETLGESAPTEQGIPLVSPATGTLFTLWVQPLTQIFGSPAATLPKPLSDDSPSMALHVAGSYPVGEIMPAGAPLEVLALIVISPRFRKMCGGWQVSLTSEGENLAFPPGVTKVEIGSVSINPDDARLVMPELSITQESVFARLSLSENNPGMLGTTVRVIIVSPWRPRVWFWLGQ